MNPVISLQKDTSLCVVISFPMTNKTDKTVACIEANKSVLNSLLGVFDRISLSCWDVHLVKGKRYCVYTFFGVLSHHTWEVALLQGHEEPVLQFAYMYFDVIRV